MERRKPVSPNAEKPHTFGISNPKRCPHPNPTWAGESLLWSSLWFSSVPVLLCKVALCRAESSLICWFPYEKCSLRKEIWPLLHQEEPWETDRISSASGVIITSKVSPASCSLDDTDNCLPWPPTLALIFTDASVGLFKQLHRRCTKCDGSCPVQLSWLSELRKAHSSKCHLWSCLSVVGFFLFLFGFGCLFFVYLFGFLCTLLKAADLSWGGRTAD